MSAGNNELQRQRAAKYHREALEAVREPNLFRARHRVELAYDLYEDWSLGQNQAGDQTLSVAFIDCKLDAATIFALAKDRRSCRIHAREAMTLMKNHGWGAAPQYSRARVLRWFAWCPRCRLPGVRKAFLNPPTE